MITENIKGLFHDRKAFSKDALEKRVAEYGFKNIARLELFLWDLELFFTDTRHI